MYYDYDYCDNRSLVLTYEGVNMENLHEDITGDDLETDNWCKARTNFYNDFIVLVYEGNGDYLLSLSKAKGKYTKFQFIYR